MIYNMDLNETILRTIEIVVTSLLEKSDFTKVIVAQILSCEDETTKKYRCKYQDIIFTVYASSPQLSFNNGDMVYVLLSNGSINENIMIIGKKY